MTPHINALDNEISENVIMPGDPLRAKFIAETYLTDYKLVSSVRNIYAYTGYYKGKRVTVMASGMGMPSIGIYSYELFKFYNVSNIIRVGSAGAYTGNLKLYDVVLVDGCYSESSYAKVQSGIDDKILYGDRELNNKIIKVSEDNDIKLNIGNIHSSDVFYKENNNFSELYEKYGCLCVEMESFALFANARLLNKHASCVLTISDSLVTHEETTSEERQNCFTKMIELVLESLQCYKGGILVKYKSFRNGAYNLHVINTDRFKTVSVRVNFKRIVSREEITIRNLLSKVLFESNKNMLNSRKIEIRTEELYNLMLKSDTFLSGNYMCINFNCSFLNEKYTEDGLTQESIKFFFDFLFEPDIVNNSFREDIFDFCRESLKEDIMCGIDSPSKYAYVRLLENIDPQVAYNIDGYLEDLDNITPSSLFEYYKSVINSDLVDIFVIGNVDTDMVKGIVNDNFMIRTLKKMGKSHYVDFTKFSKRLRYFKETRELEQSKIMIGCKLNNLTDFERKYAIHIYSFILGGGPNSKLFMNVREKNSLCYSISCGARPVSNLLVISAGINKNDYSKCLDLIRHEVSCMARGEFTMDDVKAGINTYKSTIMEVLDSPSSILNSYVSCEYLGYDFLPDRLKNIDLVTKEMIQGVAKKVCMDTVFLLEGDMHE